MGMLVPVILLASLLAKNKITSETSRASAMRAWADTSFGVHPLFLVISEDCSAFFCCKKASASWYMGVYEHENAPLNKISGA